MSVTGVVRGLPLRRPYVVNKYVVLGFAPSRINRLISALTSLRPNVSRYLAGPDATVMVSCRGSRLETGACSLLRTAAATVELVDPRVAQAIFGPLAAG